MQRQPFQKDTHLPYSKWSQHRADNGLIYLAHPITGEVKWLWSRHHDPKTGHDYLVNTITGKRHWVTKENAHFCPVKPDTQASIKANSRMETDTSTRTYLRTNTTQQASTPESKRRSSDPKSFANMPTAPPKVASAPKQDSPVHTKPKYREIPAPKSLGLTADEVLMLVPETGRRYIFNKKTKTSRWLPDRVPDTITNGRRQKPLFGKPKVSREPSSQQNDADDIHPELKANTQVPIMRTEPHGNISRSSVVKQISSGDATAKGGPGQAGILAHQEIAASSQLNVDGVDETRSSQSGAEDDEEDEVDEISRRLGALNAILGDVGKMTTSDKYNMAKLRTLSKESPSKEHLQAGSQRLLELEEYLTQQMLKVDAVESEGNQFIRAKRKETVKAILALTEEIERLREDLAS